MVTIQFNVNTSASIAFTNQLQQLHRSAFPIAVRATLNDAAFDMKTNTLQQSARDHFVIRAPTFFKRFTSVQKANGFDVNAMSSKIGFTDQGQTKVDAAIHGIEENEFGGKVTTGLAYLPGSRISGSADRAVSYNKRFSKGNVISGKFTRNGGTTKSRFIAAAIMAAQTKKLLKEKVNGRTFYISVQKVTALSGGGIKLTSKILYASRDGNNKSIKATHFTEEAATNTQKKIEGFYQKNALKQFAKYMK